VNLVTLVSGCALAVEPKIMHALIWHQSGGEPWSFAVPGERQLQVYQTVRDAIRAVGTVDRDDIAIRVGLTGLLANARSATALMLAPCPNITVAARQIAQIGERCKTIARFKADPIHCAIAAYHGSWDRPDNGFADVVRATVAKGDGPNFDMPKGTNFDLDDVGAAISPPVPASTPTVRHPWRRAARAKPEIAKRYGSRGTKRVPRFHDLGAFLWQGNLFRRVCFLRHCDRRSRNQKETRCHRGC